VDPDLINLSKNLLKEIKMFKNLLKSIWSYICLSLIIIFLIFIAAVLRTTIELKIKGYFNKDTTKIERSFEIENLKCTVNMTIHGKIQDTSGIGDAVKDAMIKVLKEKQN
jgi:hypothetical protein